MRVDRPGILNQHCKCDFGNFKFIGGTLPKSRLLAFLTTGWLINFFSSGMEEWSSNHGAPTLSSLHGKYIMILINFLFFAVKSCFWIELLMWFLYLLCYIPLHLAPEKQEQSWICKEAIK
jgi:hypothetical protein